MSLVRGMRRGGMLAALSALLLAGLAAPAAAVGADGVSMTVLVPRDADSRMPLFVEQAPAAGQLLLRNRTEEVRTVRIYAAQATQEASGAVSVGEPGSAPWMGVSEQEITLDAGQVTRIPFTLRPDRVPGDTDGRLPSALVLEAARGGTVVLQAVSLLSVTGVVPPSVSWVWIVLAAALLLAVGQRAVREWRSQRKRGALAATPSPA